jgi:patatin-like phospholipase/acyl hydrolase
MDGGGVRTIASIVFLKKLELALGEKLCHKFDYFIGTSAGAISCLSMAVKESRAEELDEVWSTKNLEKIMTNSSWKTKLGLLQSNPKYNSEGKRSVLKTHFGNVKIGEAKKPVAITSYDIEKREPVLIKSYSSLDKEISVVDAADATTAAPIYYPTTQIGDRYLIDGAIVANHPVLHGYVEAKRLYPEDELKVLSIGTGLSKQPLKGEDSKSWGIAGWMMHDLFGLMIESSMDHELAGDLIGKNYLRVNSALGDVNRSLDDNSNSNIQRINEMGDDWWGLHGEAAIKLLTV